MSNAQDDSQTKLVSVVVPAYKTGAYIAKCLQSVIEQTHANLEVIVVDDGSPDDAASIAQSYVERDRRVTLIRQENQGLSGARNAGIECMHGEYVVFLDSDDTLQPDAVERLLVMACENDADVVLPDRYIKVHDGSGKKLETLHFERVDWCNDPAEFAVNVMIGKGRAWRAHSLLYRSSLIKAHNLRFPVGRTMEDVVFNLSFLARAKRLDVIAYPTVCYLKRTESLSTTYRNDLVDLFLFVDMHAGRFCRTVHCEPSKARVAQDSLLCRNIVLFMTCEMSSGNRIPVKEKYRRIVNALNLQRVREAFANDSFIVPYWGSTARRSYVIIMRRLIQCRQYIPAIATAQLCSRLVKRSL